MTWPRLLRSELRRITSTRLPWGFLAVAAALGLLVLVAIVLSTQSEEMGTFAPDTVQLQRDMVNFGVNALLLGGLFGAVAAAREHRHGTIVATYLATPVRHRAVLARLLVGSAFGTAIGLVGGGLSALSAVVALPLADFDVLLSGSDIARAVAASSLAGAVGAGFGIGVGDVARNTGGAVTTAIVGLSILPPLAGALLSDIRPWTPNVLVARIAGGVLEPALVPALLALLAWAVVPAAAGLLASLRRDVI